MHELSVAQNIVEIVTEEANKKNALQVTKVILEVGELSGVEIDALNFAWDSAIQDTLLDHSQLKINMVKGKALCDTCQHEFTMTDLYDLCPNCQSFHREVLEGKELKIKAFEMELNP